MNPSTEQSNAITSAPLADEILPRKLRESLDQLREAEAELREQNVALLEAQDTLEAERYRFRALFESAPVPYLVTDVYGIVRMANRAAATLLGIDVQRLEGRPIANFVSPKNRHALRYRVSAIAASADAVPPVRMDIEIHSRDAKTTPVTVMLTRSINPHTGDAVLLWLAVETPVPQPSAGDLTGADSTARVVAPAVGEPAADVATMSAEAVEELRRVNAELKSANRETLALLHREQRLRRALERAERAKAHFFAVLSHELRTPLQAIFGYTELLAREIGDVMSPAAGEFMRRIERSERHLLGLLNNVLDFERMSRGTQVHVELGPVPVGEVIDAVAGMGAQQAAEQGIDLEVTRPDDCVTALGDRAMVQQVLVNLITNAIKFTPRGGRVQVDARQRADDTVSIMVCDTGRGIPADHMESIFDPFTQVAAADTRRGSGLGLAISRNIAHTLGGDLRVESEVGVGSRFTLTLPVSHSEPATSR